MKILVIDGMGGGIGKAVVEILCGKIISSEDFLEKGISAEDKNREKPVIIAAGTNAIATSAMIKAGAEHGATGENAIIYNSESADIIIGSMGIVIANSMLGEISPKMAMAISSSKAEKILIPTSKCSIHVAGLTDLPTAQYMEEIPGLVKKIISSL